MLVMHFKYNFNLSIEFVEVVEGEFELKLVEQEKVMETLFNFLVICGFLL
jgi:hypothetical protein